MIPEKVFMEKHFQFNKYGVFERKCEDDCELCTVVNTDENKVLNCCGKSIC
jgi:hypothetical protein